MVRLRWTWWAETRLLGVRWERRSLSRQFITVAPHLHATGRLPSRPTLPRTNHKTSPLGTKGKATATSISGRRCSTRKVLQHHEKKKPHKLLLFQWNYIFFLNVPCMAVRDNGVRVLERCKNAHADASPSVKNRRKI